MNRKYLLACILITGSIALVIACSKSGSDNSTTPPPNNTADDVLVNLGTNIILPSFQQLADKSAALNDAVNTFTNSPTEANLTTAQGKFEDAYKAWEACSEFEFGPAADLFLTTHFTNSFPADTVTVNSNVSGATYSIDGLGNYAAQGFPALDFLLFAGGNDHVLARFSTDANASGAKQYLAALTNALRTKAAAVATAWAPAGGNYLAKFIKASGVDAGSSLSLLINAYVKDFDVNLQNFKVGVPIGLYGPSVLPISPEKTEGYYSGFSDELLVAQLQALQNIYNGGADKGIDDKVAASGALKNGGSLNDAIMAQIAAVLVKLNALPQPLSDGVKNADPSINDAYTEIRKLTVLLKVDMCSALGVRISFQDDDGD